jgi:hypothetical protein
MLKVVVNEWVTAFNEKEDMCIFLNGKAEPQYRKNRRCAMTPGSS